MISKWLFKYIYLINKIYDTTNSSHALLTNNNNTNLNADTEIFYYLNFDVWNTIIRCLACFTRSSKYTFHAFYHALDQPFNAQFIPRLYYTSNQNRCPLSVNRFETSGNKGWNIYGNSRPAESKIIARDYCSIYDARQRLASSKGRLVRSGEWCVYHWEMGLVARVVRAPPTTTSFTS